MVKVFSLLKSLNSKEIKQFQQFVATPLYNKRSDVLRLLEYWISNRRNFSKEKAFESVFEGKNFLRKN